MGGKESSEAAQILVKRTREIDARPGFRGGGSALPPLASRKTLRPPFTLKYSAIRVSGYLTRLMKPA